MALPRPSSPRALWADLRTFAQERSKVQWVAATAAVLMPIIIVAGFIKDAKTNIAPGEQLTYVESWGSNRTDAEIKAAQEQREKDRQAAAIERQRQFKAIEKKFGM
jgi:hypothetical protein